MWHVSWGSGSGYSEARYYDEQLARTMYRDVAKRHHNARIWFVKEQPK